MTDGADETTGAGQANANVGGVATLSQEHALLARETSARAQKVLHEADQSRWPQAELEELVRYLQLEGLQHIVDEEWLLFCEAYHASDELTRLRRDHLEVRLAIDVLAQAAATRGGMTPAQLAGHVRSLLAQIDEHLAAEEKILAVAGTEAPATTTLGARPREWYALTEGAAIDLDQLPGRQGFEAVLDRLLRMTPGDHVELRGSTDPGPFWNRLSRADPGGYGSELLENGPDEWRLEITRRSDPEP